MPVAEGIRSFRDRLESLRDASNQHVAAADPRRFEEVYPQYSWVDDREDIQSEVQAFRAEIKSLAAEEAGPTRSSPLIEVVDLQALRHCMRQMFPNLRCDRNLHWGTNVHHDEGVVLGVDPPSNEVHSVAEAAQALVSFEETAATAAGCRQNSGISPSPQTVPALGTA